MSILGVSIWTWVFVLWIVTFFITECVRFFTNTFPEGIFWGVFLIFCGVMLLIHYLWPYELYVGNTLGQIKIFIFIAIILILYGVRTLMKGRISAIINIVIIGGFGFWIYGFVP
ncbi:MAG: hypothetical protein PHI40_00430 [Caldisericia bacterium]|nr:hypothetical protein [Caldisericia bacterium]MDD4613866.1 hypothetical protein [Caldisericia bacterium]